MSEYTQALNHYQAKGLSYDDAKASALNYLRGTGKAVPTAKSNNPNRNSYGMTAGRVSAHAGGYTSGCNVDKSGTTNPMAGVGAPSRSAGFTANAMTDADRKQVGVDGKPLDGANRAGVNAARARAAARAGFIGLSL